LLGKATREEVWKESLNGPKYKYVTNRRKGNDQNNDDRNKRNNVFESASVIKVSAKACVRLLSEIKLLTTYRRVRTSLGFKV
jgi:hypothetical protein